MADRGSGGTIRVVTRHRSTPVPGALDGIPQGRADTPEPVELREFPTMEQHAALVDELTRLRIEHAEHRADVVGAKGDNGKVGKLRDRIESLERLKTEANRERAATTRTVAGLALSIIGAVAAAYLSLRDTLTTMRADNAHRDEAIRMLLDDARRRPVPMIPTGTLMPATGPYSTPRSDP